MVDEQRAQAIGREGVDGADAGELVGPDLGEGGLRDHPAALDDARRPGVDLEHVDRREGGLVLPGGLRAHDRQAADAAHEAVEPVPRGRVVPGEHVGQPRRHAGVDDGGDTLRLRRRVEPKRILLEEGDVDHVDAGVDHRLERAIAHETGHRADRVVGAGHRAPDLRRVGEIRRHRLDVGRTGQARERGRRGVRHPHFELSLVRQVERHRVAHPTASENRHTLRHGVSPGNLHRPA